MKRLTKVAFIGAGYMAEEHLKVFSAIENIEISGIYSRTVEKCLLLSKKYKIKKVCNNVNELFKFTKADLLIICVPELECKKICEQSFKYNWKILIEKPVGFNLVEAKEILNLANSNKAVAYVALNRRHYSSTTKIQNRLKSLSGKRIVSVCDQEDTIAALALGEKQKVVDNWMYCNSIHLIDYFQIFCRGKIKKINHIIDWDMGKSNFVLCQLTFISGDIGLYKCQWNAPGPWSVSISTKEESLEMRPLEKASYQKFGSREIFDIEIEKYDHNFKPGLFIQAQEAIKAANNEINNLVTIQEGFKTMEVVKLIYNLNS